MDGSNLVASTNKQSDLKSYLTSGPDNGIKHERSQHTNEYKKKHIILVISKTFWSTS